MADAKAWQKMLIEDIGSQTGFSPNQVRAFAKKTIEDAIKTGSVNVDKHLKTPAQLVASVNDVKQTFDINNKKTDVEVGVDKETTAKNYYVAETEFVPAIADKKYGSLYNEVFDAVNSANTPAEAKANIEGLENQYGLKAGTLWKFGGQTYDRISKARENIAGGKAVVPKDKPNNLIEVSIGMSPTQAHDINIKILENKTVDNYSSYTPTITSVDNYPISVNTSKTNELINFPFDEKDFRTLLNYNQNKATAEDNMIIRNYFRSKYDLEPENVNEIKNKILTSVNNYDKVAKSTNNRLDNYTMPNDIAKDISKYVTTEKAKNKKNKASKFNSAVKATSNLDVENNSVSSDKIISRDIKKSAIPIFMATYDDDEEEKDDFEMMSINGLGILAIAGIMGGKHLRKIMPDAVLRATNMKDIGKVKTRISNSLGLHKEIADYERELKQSNPDLTAEQIGDMSAKFANNIQDLYLAEDEILDKFTHGNLAQRAAQMPDKYMKRIHEKGAMAREEASILANTVIEMLNLWKKETPKTVKEALIKGHQNFRNDYLNLLNDTSLEGEEHTAAINKLVNGIFDTHIAPAYLQELNTNGGKSITRQELIDRFVEFRELQNGLTFIDLEKYINNDLRSYPVKEFIESAPTGRISYLDLKRMQPEVEAKLKPLQDRINEENEAIKDYKANARRTKDVRIDQAANSASLKASEIHLAQLKADKEYTTLKQVAEIIEAADEFLTNSKSSMYFDVHAARRADERKNDKGLVIKTESGSKKFFKMLPDDIAATNKQEEILKQWGAVEGKVKNTWYIETPVLNDKKEVVGVTRDKILTTRFTKAENANSRLNMKKALMTSFENLLNTSSIISKGGTTDDVANQKKVLINQLKDHRKQLSVQLNDGDTEAGELIAAVNQAMKLAENIDPNNLNNGVDIAKHWLDIQKTINGGGNSLKNIYKSQNYDGYKNNYEGVNYTSDDYVAGFAETVAQSVASAERNAMLSEIETQYGFLSMMGLTDNRYSQWLKKERDALTDNQVQYGWLANAINNSTSVKTSMDIGARANVAVGNYFSNVYNNAIFEYTYGNAPENGLRLKNQFKNHLFAAGNEARDAYYNVKDLFGVKDPYKVKWENSAAYVKFMNDVHQSKANADAMFNSTVHYDNLTQFKDDVTRRFQMGGGLTESATSEFNLIANRNLVGQAAQMFTKGVHLMNRTADKVARRSVLKQTMDKAIEDAGGLEGIPFNDDVAMKKMADKILSDAHLASDIMFGRYNEVYKTDLEKKLLRDKGKLGQIAPTLLRFSSPYLVGAHNTLRLAEQIYNRTIAAHKNNPGAIKTAQAHFNNIVQLTAMGALALTLGGTKFISSANDFLNIMDWANAGEIDDDAMLNPVVNTGYAERTQNWLKQTLMENGLSAAGADKAIIGVKRGALTGLTNIQLSQQESLLGGLSPYVLPMIMSVKDIATQENISDEEFTNFVLNNATGGVVKDFIKHFPDVVKGSRTEKDFNMLNQEYANLERQDNETPAEKQYRERAKELYDTYNYTPLDFISDLAFNKPALLSEAKRDLGMKQNKTSTLGPDNSVKLMNAFFDNAGISITLLDDSNLKRGFKQEMTDPIIAEQYAPYIMEAFMDRLDNEELKKGLAFTSDLADNILKENQEYVAQIVKLDTRSAIGVNRANELEKIVRNVKSNAVDMLTTEVATQALNDFIDTPKGQEFTQKYKINRPSNRTYNNKAIDVARVLEIPIELKSRGEYANDKDYAIQNAKIAAITSLYNKWNDIATNTSDQSYQALRELALHIWDPSKYQLKSKINEPKQ